MEASVGTSLLTWKDNLEARNENDDNNTSTNHQPLSCRRPTPTKSTLQNNRTSMAAGQQRRRNSHWSAISCVEGIDTKRRNNQQHKMETTTIVISPICTMRRIKILILLVSAVLTHSTWRLVKVAHNSLPKNLENNPNGIQRGATDQAVRVTNRASSWSHNNANGADGIPFLSPLPKFDPIPTMTQVKSWMSQTGNETAGQFLLDFAIIGNAKCGTTTIMNWLHGQFPQIQIPRDELYHLKNREAWDLLGVFYHYFGGIDKLLPQSIKGYKSPSDITNERPIRLLRTYFPRTKLIIGLRHPISMMESFYNFRIQNGYDMPPLENVHYRNLANQYGVSWSRAEYHTTLMYLGKTNMTSPEEWALFPRQATKQIQKRLKELQQDTPIGDVLVAPYIRVPNPVFLYDTAQLESDASQHNSNVMIAQFSKDMARFLGLSLPLPLPPRHSPGRQLKNATLQTERNAKKIRICDDRYTEQRRQLLEIGSRVSRWIMDHLLKAEDVYVSNPQHFREILEGYSQDPCTAGKVDA